MVTQAASQRLLDLNLHSCAAKALQCAARCCAASHTVHRVKLFLQLITPHSVHAAESLVRAICEIAPDPEPINAHAHAVAFAVATVYNEAYGKCLLTGDDADAELDGGCAVAECALPAIACMCCFLATAHLASRLLLANVE